MTTQPEALRLADGLEMWTLGEPAAAELRRLHESNTELLAALKDIYWHGDDEKARAAIAKGEAK
jgi:hypothetical protein